MKAAYYFSEKQKKVMLSHDIMKSLPVVYTKSGLPVEFTECISTFEDEDEVPLQNNWDDSILLHVRENLPVGFVGSNGTRFAKTY